MPLIMNGCIYLITCLQNNKKYVGQHNKPDPKERWAAHKRAKDDFPFQRALKKYGISEFTWEVLLICPLDKLTEMEGYYAEVFETYIWDSPGGYNALWCSDKRCIGLKLTPEHIEKIRQANIGRKRSPEACEKMRQANLGRKVSPETKEKIRQATIGRKNSPEAIEKSRQAKLGSTHSPEARAKISKTHLGSKHTTEHIEKRRKANLGRKNSPEAIENMRIVQQKRRNQHLVQLPPLTFAAPYNAM